MPLRPSVQAVACGCRWFRLAEGFCSKGGRGSAIQGFPIFCVRLIAVCWQRECIACVSCDSKHVSPPSSGADWHMPWPLQPSCHFHMAQGMVGAGAGAAAFAVPEQHKLLSFLPAGTLSACLASCD